MQWKNDREKIVRIVYDYFQDTNEHENFISDSKTAKTILEVNSAKESNYILSKLLDELGDNSDHKVFTKKYGREYDDGSFYVARGNGFSEFDYNQFFQDEIKNKPKPDWLKIIPIILTFIFGGSTLYLGIEANRDKSAQKELEVMTAKYKTLLDSIHDIKSDTIFIQDTIILKDSTLLNEAIHRL